MQVEGGVNIKTSPLGHHGTMDPPDITIVGVGGKRHKSSSSPLKIVDSDRSTAGSIEAVVDGPGTAGGFPALANLEGVNEKVTADYMDQAEMGREEVQDQKNDAEKLDI